MSRPRHRPEFHALMSWKQPVRVAATGSVTIATGLNAGDTVDGVTLVAGDRVLLPVQSTGSQNGIYVAGASPARAHDMNLGGEVPGAVVYVIDGTANGGSIFVNTNTTIPAIGVDDLTFEAFAPGGGTSDVVPFDHGAMGSGETFDVGDSTWHRGTLDADLTTTITGFAVDIGVVILLELAQDGTGGWAITWDSDVDFGGADDQPDQAAGSVTFFLLWTSQGNSAIYGAKVGSGGSGSALEVLDEGVSLDTAVTSLNFAGGGVEATNVAHAVTVEIEGVTESNVQAVGHYELLMTGSPPEPLEDGTGTDWLYVWVYP